MKGNKPDLRKYLGKRIQKSVTVTDSIIYRLLC
jgi:hypothetical protein